MEYLFDHWQKIRNEYDKKIIFLFLDYDGTLAPIAKTPDKAAITKETRDLLKELSEDSRRRVAIISGRPLSDIKRAIGLKNVFYVGNHGLEIESSKLKFKSHVSPRLKSAIRNIAEELSNRLSSIKGVLIEDKGLTLSIHYRLVDKKDMPAFERILFGVANSYTLRGKININSGKYVYEIKPSVQWDKGKVVLWLLARQQFASPEFKVLPVYIGDDVTDEDAFKALKRKGLTIFVGEPDDSAANYYLKDTQDVARFLNNLCQN